MTQDAQHDVVPIAMFGRTAHDADVTDYDRATLALQRALLPANQAAAALCREFVADREPSEDQIADYRRRSAALKYAEAVWQAEADALIAAGTAELNRWRCV
ncbi:hypothetical protein FHP29_16320 [Nocardioides albidus]|uniref:Uncharacterized protein n=1 Tax=Nocardioides albidus TaxID=1517589 RepID=A0A5C4VNH8_9ACTN|nr:hypothetical protein [Nocardioides albidus]TNM37397.1 hypothetical protein FHP29_16320 [Nocardioides albidus]